MDWTVHSEAVEEFRGVPQEDRGLVQERVESRQNRENNILDQRGIGISYDNHGNPIHYFKIEEDVKVYRVFFDIDDSEIVLLGIRERED